MTKLAVSRVAKRSLQLIAALAVAVLCGLAVAENFERLSTYQISPSWLFIASGLLFVLAVIAGGTNWHRLLDLVAGRRLPLVKTVQGHAISWLHRYIPGVGYLGHKILWAAGNGLSKGNAVAAFLYEQLLIQASSFGFGILTLGIALANTGTMDNEAILIIAVTIVGIVVFIFAGPAIEKLLQRFRKTKGEETHGKVSVLSPAHTLVLFFAFVVPRILNAVAVVLTAVALFGINLPQGLALAGAYAVASAIGILAVFVPSGLGVREAIFVGLATLGGVSLVDAIMLSVVARVITTIADVALGTTVLATSRVVRNAKG